MGKESRAPRVNTEQYEVKFDRRREDGYWTIGIREVVEVPVPAGGSGKDLHEVAKKMIEERIKGCEVTGVVYC